MAELKEDHFEVIDGNKQRAFEERKQMRVELAEFIDKCDTYNLMKLYDEYKRIRQKPVSR
jgi:hypothetical protein